MTVTIFTLKGGTKLKAAVMEMAGFVKCEIEEIQSSSRESAD
jgi:hypothetical protein